MILFLFDGTKKIFIPYVKEGDRNTVTTTTQPQHPLHDGRRDLEGTPFHSNDTAGGSNNVTLSLPTVVDKRSHKFGRMPNSRSRKWHHRRRQDDDDSLDDITFNSSKSNMKLPLPVIVMGFPKAGTSSIFAFFHRQGFPSQHWYCCKPQRSPQTGGPDLMAACIMKNIRQNRTNNIFEGCGNDEIDIFSEINGPRRKKYHPMTGRVGFLQDDGTVDFDGPGNRIFLPQHFRIDQVHSAYPNATWILNWRDVDSWIGSVMKWGDDLHNQFFNEYFMQGAIDEIPSDKNITSVNHLLRRIYQEHYDMVREFVRLHPSHTLIEVNITAADAGNVLGQAFGLDPRAWANINKNKKGAFGSWRSQRYYGRIDFDGSPLWWLLFLGTTMYLGWFLGVEWSF